MSGETSAKKCAYIEKTSNLGMSIRCRGTKFLNSIILNLKQNSLTVILEEQVHSKRNGQISVQMDRVDHDVERQRGSPSFHEEGLSDRKCGPHH